MTTTTTRTVKAVLFDLDGTLLDTEALSDKAILQAFGDAVPEDVLAERHKDGYRLPWEIKKQILGLRGSEWIPMVISYAQEHWGMKLQSSPPNIEKFWKAWEENLNSFCEEITACPGAPELVEELGRKTNLPMAIATSSRKFAVEKKRKRHEEMFQYISEVVSGDDPCVKHGKPAPDIYLEAAKRLNVSPEDCLVFEDALSGIRSGKRAGCLVVAIPDPRFSKEEKQMFAKEADLVLDNVWQFIGTDVGIPQVNMTKMKVMTKDATTAADTNTAATTTTS